MADRKKPVRLPVRRSSEKISNARSRKHVGKVQSLTSEPTLNFAGLQLTRKQLRHARVDIIRRSRLMMQYVAQIDDVLCRNPKEAERFCADPYWKDRKRKPSLENPKEFLRYAMIYVFGGSKNREKNASQYATAVYALLCSNIPRDNIAAAIKEKGGIKAIVDRFRKGRTGSRELDEEESTSGASEDDAVAPEEHDHARTPADAAEYDPNQDIIVRVTKEQMILILDGPNDMMRLKVERVRRGENQFVGLRLVALL